MAKRKRRSLRLAEVLEPADKLLIVTHNNPDPDALASALALRAFYEKKFGRQATITYSGLVGRAENRAMVRLLGMNLVPFGDLNLADYPAVALVDSQPGTGNNPLPPDFTPQIVIDHHPVKTKLPPIPFRRIMTRYGATSTIMAAILQEAKVPIDPKLATALVYGIKSDTSDFCRIASSADQEIYLRLFPQADKRLLADIGNAQVPREYYEDVLKSLDNAVVRGKVVFSDIGKVEQPDMVAEMADFFVRLENMRWSICMGTYRKAIFLSIRTLDPKRQANWVMQRLVAGLGSGGGHGQMAGGRIPLNGSEAVEEIREKVKQRAIDTLKVRRRREVQLVRESSKGEPTPPKKAKPSPQA